MPHTVCIDTHIVIWALRENAEKGQEYRIPQAQQLLKMLEEEKAIVIIPAIAASEAAIGVPSRHRDQFLNDISSRCRVVPYDRLASSHYASFFGENRQLLQKEELMQSVHGFNRKAINADAMILATALAHRATILYTIDERLKKIAAGHIQVKGLPRPRDQHLSLLSIAAS